MTVKEVPQRVWRGRRKVMRLQRDLWLAQLAVWPTLIVSAVLLSALTWALWQRKWQRKSVRSQPDAVPPVTDPSWAGASPPQAGLSG
ncbi:hypothetical protein A5756_12525 [Mycobacterium sp. 852002-53434_SCH5985345]|uniref:hypothetical protein n=1 Tax=unclassified Mycobacterium TaxID=2642494 RepID=UPI0007FF68FA|nr:MULTISPECIES: hypothetical protein [unclassified Mycobacterium]OBF55505.1 hypothetical protein A5756_12525 [Mycobacterium sp. 852002-53434_SCH5985345]OBF70522.1 hypothetical protein A5750_23430 [Mycobacterium sp. 852002-51613_SCH5001154]OBF91953.1 hypothetical protein A5773_21965 [Mycobacterium sp. 852014-52450_SCH5900713]